MPPLNWTTLHTLDVEKLEEDEADEWFQELQSVNVDKETDSGRLQALFRLCRAVLNIKAVQAETAIEEGERMMKSQTETGTEEAKLLQEIDDLKEQISTLRRQAGGKDANSLLREEIRDLEEEKHGLTRELVDSKQELRHEQEKSEKYLQRIETYEKEFRELRKEKDQLLEDVRDYQRQLQRHRESVSERRTESEDFQKRIRNRNDEMLKLVNEVNNLAESNEMLRKQVDELKMNLEECTSQMEKTTDQYSRMKDALNEADMALESLQNENQDLQRQLAEMGVRGLSQPSIQDELMAAVDKKIEEWKKIFRDQDTETQSYKKQVEELQQELIQYRMDSDKHSVFALTKALEDRDQQIQLLRDELAKSTKDIETNANLLEELRDQLNAGGSVSETQKRRMNLLQKTLKEKDTRLAEALKKAQEADTAAIEKDKQMADLISRMRQYEMGEYGLAEAVDDCREFKVQLDIRNKQAVELTQHCNKLELKVNELLDENDEMRRRIGLDKHAPLDIKFKYAREVERETDRAMNIILQKEIELLEEERIDLKLQMRKLTHKIGERAVALGLSSDELMAVEQFMENLKEKGVGRRSQSESRAQGDRQELISPLPHYRSSHQSQKLLDDVGRENRSLKTKLAHLETENAKLLQGLKEVRMQLQDVASKGTGDVSAVQMPTLDRLISYMETRELTGNVDAVLQIKSQLDYMTGRNDELRSELRHLTLDMQKTNVELHQTKLNTSKLENELKLWKDLHATGPTLQPIPFAENMPPTSSIIIANLNEHLIQTLHESDLKEQQLKCMEEAMDAYQRKLAVLKHQQGLVFKEYLDANDNWEKEKVGMGKKLRDSELLQMENESRKVELERLTDTLNQSEDEIKRRLGEMTRKYIVMRINEKTLIRKYAILGEMESEARKDKEKAEKNALQAETAVIQKLGYLERQREMVSYQLSSLYKALEDSVPKADYDILNRQHIELTEKHRTLLEEESELVRKIKSQENTEIELNQLQRENDYLKAQLLAEKERSIKLELLEEASRVSGVSWPMTQDGSLSGSDGDSGISVSELRSVSQRLAVLEMKELNERQRATHAQMMYAEQRDLLKRVEERNMELERKFEAVTKLNLEMQKVERELRDELTGCVTREINEVDKQRIAKLELSEATLRAELEKVKELDEVSRAQFRYLENQRACQNMELEELRKTVIDIQAGNDFKAAIGKLHREIVSLKLAETIDNADLKSANDRIRILDVQSIRLRTKLDAKERELRHFRTECIFRMQHMRRTITTLRQRFAGTVPLENQEKFQKTLLKLQSDRERLQKELVEAVEKRHEANDRIEEMKLRQTSLEELISSVKEGAGTKRIMEWHHKLEDLRLSELKLKRQLARAQEQIKTQETLLSGLESASSNLEEENVKITKAWEEREITWENREAELEAKLRQFELQERENEEDMLEISAGDVGLPDMTLPLQEQLEKALVTLRKFITADKISKGQIDKLKKELDTSISEKRKLESELLRKQRLLFDLRKFVLPGAVEVVDSAISGGWPAVIADMQTKTSLFDQQNVHKAAQELLQATVTALKARIDHKDEALEKYRQLLQATQTELNEARKEQFEESAKLRDQLREALERIPNTRQLMIEHPEEDKNELEKQLYKIVELEDKIISQENTITTLLDKLNSTDRNESLTAELAERLVKLEAENMRLQTMLRHAGSPVDSIRSRIHAGVMDNEKGETADQPLDHESSVHSTEQQIISANVIPKRDVYIQTLEDYPAPAVTLPNVQKLEAASSTQPEHYVKLKVRLDHATAKLKEREAENKALKHALADLQNDMTTQAITRLRPESENGMRELEMKDLKLKVEELENRLLRQAKESKRGKDMTEEMEREVDSLKGEITRKDGTIAKLKADKEKLEKEVDNLEARLAHLRESVKMKLQEKENRELKRKLAQLDGQLRTIQGLPAEKPLEGPIEMRPEGVLKWEESKRWQMRVDKLKNKLQAKTSEADEYEKLIERLKERISRLEQEKSFHEFRGAVDKLSTVVTVKPLISDDTQTSDKKGNKAKAHDALQMEVSTLRLKNRDLAQRCLDLEMKLIKQQNSRNVNSTHTEEQLGKDRHMDGFDEDTQNGRTLDDADNVIQMLRRLLDQACNERDQLKMDRDAVQKRLDEEREENEALHSRMRDIQKELQLAHEEIVELRDDLEGHPRTANIETINRLHETIDKLENEKLDLTRQLEELKLSSARLSDQDLQKIVQENKDLKAKLSKAAPRVAWAEQLVAETRERPTGTLVRENGKLKSELTKLRSEIDHLRSEIETIRSENGKLEEELKRLQSLNIQTRRWLPTGAGHVDAMARLMEDKDEALQKRTIRLAELEDLLKKEIEKNQRYLFENHRLKEKVQALEWILPREAGSSAVDYLRQIRILKAELSSKQSELSEVKAELEMLNRQIKPSFDSGTDLDYDVWKERMKIYDRVLRENIELKLECNKLKMANRDLH